MRRRHSLKNLLRERRGEPKSDRIELPNNLSRRQFILIPTAFVAVIVLRGLITSQERNYAGGIGTPDDLCRWEMNSFACQESRYTSSLTHRDNPPKVD